MKEKIRLIFTSDEMSRLEIIEKKGIIIRIIVDVHGMRCYQARRFINNIINVARTTFQLVIIHGYNHGTAIKDMLAQKFRNSRIEKQHIDPYNQGVTCMFIAA